METFILTIIPELILVTRKYWTIKDGNVIVDKILTYHHS